MWLSSSFCCPWIAGAAVKEVAVFEIFSVGTRLQVLFERVTALNGEDGYQWTKCGRPFR